MSGFLAGGLCHDQRGTAEEGRDVSLSIRDLVALPAQPEAVCELAEAFVRDWVPSVALSDEDLEPQLASVQTKLGTPVPPALGWLYSRLGISGRRLFQQDPIVHLENLMVDEHDVVRFRTEQQGCVEWGYRVTSGADPDVVVRNHMTLGTLRWEPFQSRLSIHVLEGVLSEAIFCSGAPTASLDSTPPALEALDQLVALGIPPHPFWAAPDGELVSSGTGVPRLLCAATPTIGCGQSARPRQTYVG
jgi:hypothetical protein